MSSRTRKAVCTYLLLLSAVLQQSYCQISPGFNNAVAGHTSSTFKQSHSSFLYPQNGYIYTHPAAKGFYPVSAVNTYNKYPLNGQYWTGQPLSFIKYPQYPQYQQVFNYPASYKFFPQQIYHKTGFNNHYGQYPIFDANYWMGNNFYPLQKPMYINPMAPVYMHPVPMYHNPMYYQGQNVMYYNHPYNAVPYPVYHGNYHDRGFLGGTGGELAKGLLGALLVGAVVGTVARRG